MGKALDMLIPRGHGLQGGDDLPVEHLSARWQKALVGYFPNSVVREIEPVAHTLKNATAHELFDGRGCVTTGQAGRTLQQAELELSTDHRRYRRYGLSALAESVQAPRDHRSNSLGRR
jgi:hypothetical protein